MNFNEEDYEDLDHLLESSGMKEKPHVAIPVGNFKGFLPGVEARKSYINTSENGFAALSVRIPETEVTEERLEKTINKYNLKLSETNDEKQRLSYDSDGQYYEITVQGIKTEQVNESEKNLVNIVGDLSPKYFFEHEMLENQEIDEYVGDFRGYLPNGIVKKSFLHAETQLLGAIGIRIPETEVTKECLEKTINEFNLTLAGSNDKKYHLAHDSENQCYEIARYELEIDQVKESEENILNMVLSLAPKYFFEHEQ